MQIHLNEVIPPQPPNTPVALDIEVFGLNQKTMHRPTTGEFACLSLCPNDEDVYVLWNKDVLHKAINNIKDTLWIIQLSKFDITHLRRWTTVAIVTGKQR